MRMQAVQSALAIRRQRNRREEQRRAKARRYSSQSDNLMLSPSGSTLRGSVISLDGKGRAQRSRQKEILTSKVMGTVTMFHVGIVFIMLGLMLVISSLVPGYINRDWEELLGTGCFLVFIGIILTVINRIVSSKEEEKFSKYITKKLAPTKTHGPMKLVLPELRKNDDQIEITIPDDASPAPSDDKSLVTSPSQLECIVEELEAEKSDKRQEMFTDIIPIHESRSHQKLIPSHESPNEPTLFN